MKRTIDFLVKNGIIDELQNLVNMTPKVVIDDDPDFIKKFVPHTMGEMIIDRCDKTNVKFIAEFMKAVCTDIAEEIDIKKTDETGSELLGLILKDVIRVKNMRKKKAETEKAEAEAEKE